MERNTAIKEVQSTERNKDMTSNRQERTITLDDLLQNAQKYGYWTMTVKDESVRGATDKGIYEIEVGDWVLMENKFYKVTL